MIGANIVSIIVMLIVGYSYLIDPTNHPRIGVLGLFFPACLLVNLAFLVLWTFGRSKYILIPFVGLLLAYVPTRAYFPINIPSDDIDGTLKVMSYNAHGFRGLDDIPLSKENNELADFLIQSDCDIICLQEAEQSYLTENMKARLHEKYPSNRIDTRHSTSVSVAIYSKYKILAADSIPYESAANFSMVYTLDVDGDTVYVINNHLETTGLTVDDRNQFRSMMKGELQKEEAKDESRSVIAKLGRSSSIRAQQARAVADYISTLKGKRLIVCGDFNDNPVSYTRYTVAKGLTDSFVSSGNGFGWSFCHHGMRVRIDNILCSEDFAPQKCIVDDKVRFSDHFPIISWLKMDTNLKK